MKRSCVREGFSLFFGMIHSGWQLVRGVCLLARMSGPIVTIFGGMRAQQTDEYAKQAYQLARMLAQHNMSVLTGGGPGIMEAASCGAASVPAKKYASVGIGVKDVDAQFENPCVFVLKMRYFFTRKWLLVRYSQAFVVFPGGIGTVDELFEVLNLVKHSTIAQVPVVLIGEAYWKPLLDWFNDSALKEGFIKQEYLKLFIVTDSLEEALRAITPKPK